MRRFASSPDATAVYRCYSATGQLLYIGMTHTITTRLEQHTATTPWWPEVDDVAVEFHSTREAAIAAERAAILAENPLHNRQRIRPRVATRYRVLTPAQVPYSGTSGLPMTDDERMYFMGGGA